MRFNGAAPEGEVLTLQLILLSVFVGPRSLNDGTSFTLQRLLIVCRLVVVCSAFCLHRVSRVLPILCAVINSRLAMLGCVAALTAELTTQTTVFEQV